MEYEAVGIIGTGANRLSVHLGILVAEADDVAPRAAWVELGGVDFNNGDTLCVPVGAS